MPDTFLFFMLLKKKNYLLLVLKSGQILVLE